MTLEVMIGYKSNTYTILKWFDCLCKCGLENIFCAIFHLSSWLLLNILVLPQCVEVLSTRYCCLSIQILLYSLKYIYLSYSQGGRSSGTSYIHRGYQRRSRYNKDEFLQANFRFLVSDAVDIQSFVSEADKMFEWEDIAQVPLLKLL